MRRTDLPLELLFEVLLRVPAKDLVRFTVVCKLWFSMIKSPNFLITYVKYLKDVGADEKLLLLDEQSFSVISDSSFAVVRNISHTFPVRSGTDLILGSCNGLICVALRSNSSWNVILWNPALRKCKVIDEVQDRSGSWFDARGYYALGWHEINNDLRVVKLYRRSNIAKISVYSLNTGTWNPYVGKDVPVTIIAWNHCFAKGAIHWMNMAKVGDRFLYQIASFNLVEECFKEIALPEECYHANDNFDNGSMAELRGTLSFVPFWIPNSRRGNNYVDVWLMQEYGVQSSWTKVFTVQMSGMIERSLGFTKSERLICSYKFGIGEMGVAAAMNLNTGDMEVFPEAEITDLVLNYMETLLLI